MNRVGVPRTSPDANPVCEREVPEGEANATSELSFDPFDRTKRPPSAGSGAAHDRLRPTDVLAHTWFMVVRQARNLMREPIWIVLLLVSPIVWLTLYGRLIKNVPRLGGFGTNST
jgi:hypothetical protein